MKRLLVKTIGTGTADDPVRVALPTYTEVFTDYKAGTAIVDVPDDAICPCIDEHTDDVQTVTAKADDGDREYSGVITSAKHEDADHYKNWYDEKYQEHAGKFDVEFPTSG